LEQFAVISDIHGNRWALQAVLEDIDRVGLKKIVNLGDSLYGPLDPAGTSDILIELNLPTIQGNQDRIITSAAQQPNPTLSFVRECLSDNHLSWLGALEPTMSMGDIFLCHGTPASDATYLFWDITPAGAIRRTAEDVAADLSSVDHSLVLCGHDHVPYAMALGDGRMVANPGSVGLQAYCDDQPHPHQMATGAAHAHYTRIYKNDGNWIIRDIAVAYDWQAARRQAQKQGRPDWARWLTTGCA
jgi:predicted phosphodiesterase